MHCEETMSMFDSIESRPEDPILGLAIAFNNDTRSNKVNLGIGSYKNSEGRPQVLSCVRKAEKILLQKNLDKEYLPILGSSTFIRESLKLTYGKDSSVLAKELVAAAQTIGATGALRLGGDFLFQNKICSTVFLSDPTWPNHNSIFSRAGMKLEFYAYYNTHKHAINFNGMHASISKMPPGSLILFQPCCHNPTGLTPTFEQWQELSSLIKHHKLIPFFDLAYQGFDISPEDDAKTVRFFAEAGHNMLVATSYSKNFGLYGERVGLLSIICTSKDEALRVSSQIKQIIRGNYSVPPLQGERIITTILQSDELRNEWIHELENMKNRIKEMRKTLLSELLAKGAGNSFQFLSEQSGMFSFSGLNQDQVHRLRNDFGIYLPSNGRVNVAGLNTKNIEYVIDSILAVM
jgi:aspartate aminotransferase